MKIYNISSEEAEAPSLCNLTEQEIQLLLRQFSFHQLRPHQEASIASMLAGRDVVLLSGTGSGKTEAMLGASILHPKHGLYVQVEPLKAIQADMMKRMTAWGIHAAVLNSNFSKAERLSILEAVRRGEITHLITTPEQLTKHRVFDALNETGVGYLVIDEAHCVLNYGESFRPEYGQIGSFLSYLRRRPVVAACTATLSPEKIRPLVSSLNMKDPVILPVSIDRPEIIQHIIEIGRDLKWSDRDLVDQNRFARLTDIIDRHTHPGDGVIVYCITPGQVQSLTQKLIRKGYHARSYYGSLDERQRHDLELSFLSPDPPIIVATSAFGMGIDKPNVRLVVHMSLPLSIEDYWQKTGRAGRDGQVSHSFLLWWCKDSKVNDAIVKDSPSEKKDLKELKEFLTSNRCYTQQLREYFGFPSGKPCGKCSICRKQ